MVLSGGSLLEVVVRFPFAVICGVALAATVAAQAPSSALSVAEVEKVTGIKGVRIVAPGSQPGAGPGLDFAGPDNTLIVMVNVGPAALYTRARTQKEMEVGGQTYPMELFHANVPGVGDEAFDSPPGDTQYVIYLRKGTQAATVSTYLSHGQPVLTMAQLTALAKFVAGHI